MTKSMRIRITPPTPPPPPHIHTLRATLAGPTMPPGQRPGGLQGAILRTILASGRKPHPRPQMEMVFKIARLLMCGFRGVSKQKGHWCQAGCMVGMPSRNHPTKGYRKKQGLAAKSAAGTNSAASRAAGSKKGAGADTPSTSASSGSAGDRQNPPEQERQQKKFKAGGVCITRSKRYRQSGPGANGCSLFRVLGSTDAQHGIARFEL